MELGSAGRLVLVFCFIIVLIGCAEVYAETKVVAVIEDIEQILAESGHFVNLSKRECEDIAVAVVLNAAEFELDPYLVLGIIRAESSGRAWVENRNCIGLMQVNATVWLTTLRDCGIAASPSDLLDVERNIRAGCYILKLYLDKAKDIDKALRRYSGYKDGRGRRYIAKCRGYLKDE